MEYSCHECTQAYTVTEEEARMRTSLSPLVNGAPFSLPTPTLCPACRQRRRLSFRNERSYYKRHCSRCQKNIIAIYPEHSVFPVYCHDCYWSGAWDPLSYGINYNQKEFFFSQFYLLQERVPRLYFSSTRNENCEYSNHVANCRNCYLLVGSMESEDCHYGYRVFHSRDCLDCLFIEHCELCYECINCENCYNVRFAFNCHQVHDSVFVEHCYGSSDLLYCAGIHHGRYQVLNQQLTREEFARQKERILSSSNTQKEYDESFALLKTTLSLPKIISERCEDCTGNCMITSKHCSHVFDVHDLEDVNYAYDCGNLTDSMDAYSVYGPGSGNYEVYSASIAVYNNLFIRDCWPAENLIYCDHCFGSRYCFGCIGLQKHIYCIFNRQYTKEEYEQKVAVILKTMTSQAEWGEFFPVSSSPFPLSDTPANEQLPDPSKPFKLISAEKRFYEKMHLTEPTMHPDARHHQRLIRKKQYLSL